MAEGQEQGELVIENERLKTSIMVLQQKLKVQDDSEGINGRLKKQVRDLEEEVDEYKSNVSTLESENASL